MGVQLGGHTDALRPIGILVMKGRAACRGPAAVVKSDWVKLGPVSAGRIGLIFIYVMDGGIVGIGVLGCIFTLRDLSERERFIKE